MNFSINCSFFHIAIALIDEISTAEFHRQSKLEYITNEIIKTYSTSNPIATEQADK